MAVHAFAAKEDKCVFSSGEAVWWGYGVVSVVVLVSVFEVGEIGVFLLGVHGGCVPLCGGMVWWWFMFFGMFGETFVSFFWESNQSFVQECFYIISVLFGGSVLLWGNCFPSKPLDVIVNGRSKEKSVFYAVDSGVDCVCVFWLCGADVGVESCKCCGNQCDAAWSCVVGSS